jgi:hypothetical protein
MGMDGRALTKLGEHILGALEVGVNVGDPSNPRM